ncbi:MAG: glycine--tRNA ligase subunit beta, partial [Methylotenera sp. 17-45-7]
SIGEKPTGDKDPFALRRQALGIIRMLIDTTLPLSLNAVMETAFSQFVTDPSAREAVKDFCYDRLSVNLRDQGASPQEVDAVLSLTPELMSEVPARLAAVRSFAGLTEAPALAAANKRVGNILKKVECEVSGTVSTHLLQEPAEIALAEALNHVKPKADQLFEAGDYTASLQALAILKAPVDAFFDNVMVNAEEVALKNNRLALLNQLHQAMNRVADLSKLAS